MQPDLHPSWQRESHDAPDEGEPVRVNVHEADPTPMVRTVSRRPAAAVGMVMVLGLLGAMYGTSSLLHGQTSPTPPVQTGPTVRITENGFDPALLAVRPGDTVTWINESSIPHLLSSQDIDTVDGPLDTSPVFPESSMAVTIASDATIGTFRYVSLTSTLSGELTIDPAAPASAISSSSASSLRTAEASSFPSSAVPAAVTSSVRREPSTPRSSLRPFPPAPSSAPEVPVIPTAAVGTLPRNPYALNRPDYVDPVQPSSSSSSRSSSSASATHAGAPLEAPTVTKHTPSSQPGTGPDDWAVVIMAVMAMGTLLAHAQHRKAWTYRD